MSDCVSLIANDVDHYSPALTGHLCPLWIYIFGSCLLPTFYLDCLFFNSSLELHLLDASFVRYLSYTFSPPLACSVSLHPLDSLLRDFPGGIVVKNLSARAGDTILA